MSPVATITIHLAGGVIDGVESDQRVRVIVFDYDADMADANEIVGVEGWSPRYSAVTATFEPPAVPHLPALGEEFLSNPTGSLATVRCSPWYYQDKVVLLGDAAHAVVPFYGQGMNASFEDSTVLNEFIA